MAGLTSNDFLLRVVEYVSARIPKPREVRFATVDPAYVATSYPGTLPRVTFDGEDDLSVRGYAVVGPYLPAPGERVMLVPAGITYAIVGPVTPSAWQAYTPVWTAATTNPVLGSGTIQGRWGRAGRTITYSGRILMGADTTYGSGAWLVSLPVAAASVSLGAGSAVAYNGAGFPGSCWLQDASRLIFFSSSFVTGTSPFTWASGNQLRWTVTYEAA